MTKQINTISQALRKIKDLKGRVALLDRRMQESICWIEPGDKPVYNFATLSEERQIAVDELVTLKGRLVKTNATTNITLPSGKVSIQTAVFIMAEAKARKNLLATLPILEGEVKVGTGGYDENGHPRYELKRKVAALGLLKRDDQVAALEQFIAELNEVIEDANHRTTLAE